MQTVTAAMKLRRHFLIRRIGMVNLDSVLKSRGITWPTKVHIVKVTVFLIVIYGCKSWTIKKAECWKTDAFELWCWRSISKVPWTAKRSDQLILRKSTLNIHWKDWCWSWKPNTLATWCEEMIHWKRSWCSERLRARGERGYRGCDGWMASTTQTQGDS